MAKVVLKDCSVVVNGVDLSNHAVQVAMNDEAEKVDITGFQSAYREFDQGLKDGDVSVTFISDFAAASVDATLAPLYAAGSTFDVVIKPTSAVVSATNPSYTMTVRLYSYAPLSGGVGDRSDADVNFANASQAGIVKATS